MDEITHVYNSFDRIILHNCKRSGTKWANIETDEDKKKLRQKKSLNFLTKQSIRFHPVIVAVNLPLIFRSCDYLQWKNCHNSFQRLIISLSRIVYSPFVFRLLNSLQFCYLFSFYQVIRLSLSITLVVYFFAPKFMSSFVEQIEEEKWISCRKWK